MWIRARQSAVLAGVFGTGVLISANLLLLPIVLLKLSLSEYVFARRLALVMLSFIGMALIVFFAGNTLLAWKGTDKRLLAAPYLVFYLVNLAQELFYVQFGMLAFTENVVPFFKIGLYTGLAVIAVSLILTPLFGLWGLLAAPFIAEMAGNTWFTVRRGFQGQPLTPRQFVLAAIRGHV